MSEENPLDRVLDEIASILKMAEEEIKQLGKKPISKEMLKNIENLEQQIDLFDELQKRSMEQAGVDMKRLEQVKTCAPKEFAPKDQRMMEKIKELKGEIYQMKNLFEKEKKKIKKDGDEEQKGAKRKKKFRGVGGSKKWKKI